MKTPQLRACPPPGAKSRPRSWRRRSLPRPAGSTNSCDWSIGRNRSRWRAPSRPPCATTSPCSLRHEPATANRSPTSCPASSTPWIATAAAHRLDPHDFPPGTARDQGSSQNSPETLQVHARSSSATPTFKSTVLVGKSIVPLSHHAPRVHALADLRELVRGCGLRRAAADRRLGRHDRDRIASRPAIQPPRSEVWDAVNADSSSCSRKHCDGEKCFYQRARARLRSAHVIIVNHALLFALINAGGAKAQGWRDRHAGRPVSRRLSRARRGAHRTRGCHRQLRPRAQQLWSRAGA